MARRFQTYRCGGYSSYTGHCGAGDCETCHPGGAAQIRADEAREEWESEHLDPFLDERDALWVTLQAADERHLDTTGLEDALEALEDRIDEIEYDAPDFEADGYDDEPDYDDYDPEYDRVQDAYERGI